MSDNTATLPEYRAQLAALIEARRSPLARFRRCSNAKGVAHATARLLLWLASALDTLSRKVMT